MDEDEAEVEFPTELDARRAMFRAWLRLKELGWREAMYAPCDNTPIEVIEAGSTGVHLAHRDKERRFWIEVSGKQWPSRPMLFRLRKRAPSSRRIDDR